MHTTRRTTSSFCIALACCLIGSSLPGAHAQFTQQGSKLVGSGIIGQSRLGLSVAISADGNTAVLGGPGDNNGGGATWVFVRKNGTWSQHGGKLFGDGGEGSGYQGRSVAISRDGSTIIVGGPNDAGYTGAAWVFVRSGDNWIQQGPRLVGGNATYKANQGTSVALSSDGNTALVSGSGDSVNIGATWVFVRSGGVWTQQGEKLVGSGVSMKSWQGASVALSGDGNTAVIGGAADSTEIGAVWVFVRNGDAWSQQGDKIVGGGGSGIQNQGGGVSIAKDGNTIVFGGAADNGLTGAVWVYRRSGTVWTQDGQKLVPSDIGYHSGFGRSVSLSDDSKTLVAGASSDESTRGALWVFKRADSGWVQYGTKLVGTEGSWNAMQGTSVSVSGNGATAVSGGPHDTEGEGAAWVFADKSLAVTVSDPQASELPGKGGLVRLYDTTGSLVCSAETDSSSTATFLGVAPGGDYSVTVDWPSADPGAFIDTIYWGRKSGISIGDGSPSSITFERNAPRLHEFEIIDLRTGLTALNQTVYAGFPLSIQLAVKNHESAGGPSAEIRGRVLFRTDTTSAYTIDLTSDVHVIPAQAVGQITDSLSPIAAGAYYGAIGVLTAIMGTERHSDWVEYRSGPLLTVAWPPLPEMPLLLSPADSAPDQPVTLQLQWRSTALALRYAIQLSADSIFAAGLVVDDSSQTDTVMTLEGLPYSTDLYWRVQGVNIAGRGAWSAIRRFKTVQKTPPAPSLLSPANRATGIDTIVTLQWTRSPGAAMFLLEVASDSLFTPRPDLRVMHTADTSAVVRSLAFSTSYWWHVKAKGDSSGYSPFTETWTFSTGLPIPGTVVLISPLHDAVVNSDTMQMAWHPAHPSVSRYWLEYGIDSGFVVKATDSLLTDTARVVSSLVKNMTYYWRVRAGNSSGWGAFSHLRRFHRSTLDVADHPETIPQEWVLEQNYPNPFNPTTTIRYALPRHAQVHLTVFNTLGQQVALLYQGEQEAGFHEVRFDASELTSGIYWCRLQVHSTDIRAGQSTASATEDFVQIRKLLLLR